MINLKLVLMINLCQWYSQEEKHHKGNYHTESSLISRQQTALSVLSSADIRTLSNLIPDVNYKISIYQIDDVTDRLHAGFISRHEMKYPSIWNELCSFKLWYFIGKVYIKKSTYLMQCFHHFSRAVSRCKRHRRIYQGMDNCHKTIHFTLPDISWHVIWWHVCGSSSAVVLSAPSVVVMWMSPLGRINCFYMTRFLLGGLAAILT